MLRHVVCRLVSNRPLKCINGLINIWLLASKVVSGSDYLRVFEDWCTAHCRTTALGLGHQHRIRLASYAIIYVEAYSLTCYFPLLWLVMAQCEENVPQTVADPDSTTQELLAATYKLIRRRAALRL